MNYTARITDPETNRKQDVTATSLEVLRELLKNFNKCFIQFYRN